MKNIILEGDPKTLAHFDQELREELAQLGLADRVTVETQTVQASLIPGELGFGEEIRQILLGIADVLKAGKEAIGKVAEGVGKRLAQRKLTLDVRPDGHIVVRAGGSLQGTAELTQQIAEVIRAQQRS